MTKDFRDGRLAGQRVTKRLRLRGELIAFRLAQPKPARATKGDVMADHSESTRVLDQAVENALKAYDDGYRIIAGWFNAAFKTATFRTEGDVEIDVDIKADPPPPGVTLDDCRRRLSNSLVAIRPHWKELETDERQLWPWVAGYLATETDQPGEKCFGIALAKDPHLAWASLDTVEAVENIVRIKRSRWKDAGKWRAYVIEPMEENAKSWREWMGRFHSGNATPTAGKQKAAKPGRTVPKGKILLGRTLQFDWLTYLDEGEPDDENEAYNDWRIDIDNGLSGDFDVSAADAKALRRWFAYDHLRGEKNKDDRISLEKGFRLSDDDKTAINDWLKSQQKGKK